MLFHCSVLFATYLGCAFKILVSRFSCIPTLCLVFDRAVPKRGYAITWPFSPGGWLGCMCAPNPIAVALMLGERKSPPVSTRWCKAGFSTEVQHSGGQMTGISAGARCPPIPVSASGGAYNPPARLLSNLQGRPTEKALPSLSPNSLGPAFER